MGLMGLMGYTAKIKEALAESKGRARRAQNPQACLMVMPSRSLLSAKLRQRKGEKVKL